MADMFGITRRDFAFLLIGLGAGLLLSAAAIIEFIFQFHHMFIIGFEWRPLSILLVSLPFLFVFAGIAILRAAKSEAKPL